MASCNEQANETTGNGLVCGRRIQWDASGVGHAWFNVEAEAIPANIREEIAAEILDGGNETHANYTASNGQHYRW